MTLEFNPDNIGRYHSAAPLLMCFNCELEANRIEARLKYGDDIFIDILDERIIEKLLDHVPCYVGGEWLYSDSAKVHGLLEFQNSRPVIPSVSYVEIFREEEGNYIIIKDN